MCARFLAHGLKSGRIARRVAVRDAFEHAVVEYTEFAKGSNVVALDAGGGEGLDVGVDAIDL